MNVHQEWLTFEQSYRYTPKYSKEVEQHYLKHLIRLLQVQGFTVLRMSANAHWDLTIAYDGHVARIEVKIARPRNRKNRTRDYYQFKLQSGGHRPIDGDVLICCCCPNGPVSMDCFIVPTEALGNRKTLEITSEPENYTGQWSTYHNAWNVLDEKLQGGKND